MKRWLTLADFELVKHHTFFFRPPLKHEKLHRRLNFLEWMGSKCYRAAGWALYFNRAGEGYTVDSDQITLETKAFGRASAGDWYAKTYGSQSSLMDFFRQSFSMAAIL